MIPIFVIVANITQTSAQISKVHLKDSGRIVVVDLEPSLAVSKKTKNDMPYWRSWQEVCIEVR
jgi:hypothetical protein